MSENTQRRLAAIVSADVVGYSRLMGVDEVRAALAENLKIHPAFNLRRIHPSNAPRFASEKTSCGVLKPRHFLGRWV